MHMVCFTRVRTHTLTRTNTAGASLSTVRQVSEERISHVEKAVTTAAKAVRALRAVGRNKRRMTNTAKGKSLRNLIQRTMETVGSQSSLRSTRTQTDANGM